MGYLDVMTAENIVEGFIASIFIVLSYYVLRNYYKLSKAKKIRYLKLYQ